MSQLLDRCKVLSVDVVMPMLTGETIKADERTEIEGVKAHVSGLRLTTFKLKGLKCVTCGIEGSFFALERSFEKSPSVGRYVDSYHLNLYAMKEESGETVEVLMTHDHILARGLCGEDTLENCQTMCSPCNSEKSIMETVLVGKQREYNRTSTEKEVSGKGTSRTVRKRRAQKALRLVMPTTLSAAVVQSTPTNPQHCSG